ncbi:MAG: efflux RND transporter permease subunit, partial [Planctomycetes bacterium]|nr:efflux RND transporter permease subunit [Planctomycetota bacterium]
MSLGSLNTDIRLKIVQGENIDVIKAELPPVMKEKLAGAIISAIKSKNISIRGESASLENSVKIDSRHIPFRRVKNIRELMYDEMDPVFNFPGLVNAWTMPIKTRIDMLATGIKTPIGIKILGPDLKKLEELAIKVEAIVKRDPGTLSAIAERVMGGNYLDFEIKRKECARYGLTIDEVQDVIQSAIGGMNVSQTVEGLYRFNINVRYPREMRDNPESLKRILIPTPTGQQIPITQVADIVIKTGPPAIKSENAMRQAIVYVDLKGGQDVGSYV